nr:Gfo/Idh/MocA family oxidoreductase [Candidatus Sigynarchaeota archaeon]
LIDADIIGSVYLGRTYEGAFVPLKHFTDPLNWQFTYDKGGGGVLMDQGVHKFGLFNWLLGEIESGQAWLGKAVNSPPNKGEDNAFMLVRYKSGAMIEIAVSSTASHPLNNNSELVGTKGHILEDHSWDKPLKVFSKHPDAVKKGEYYEVGMEHGAYPKYYMISAFHEDTHFAECVLNDTKPEFTPEQAKEAVAGVLLGYLSAKKGAPAKMDELKSMAASKGTKQLLQGLEDVVLKNYQSMKW